MTSNPEEIGEYIESLGKEREAIKEQIVDVCFFMKGGLTYGEAWQLSFNDRVRIVDRINKWNKEMGPDDGKEFM